uniref:CSON005822 protein n=1 Tax=Culicoides sonorensis TaxID=179676 RepID=A0A336LZ64_CULSO
MSAQEFQLQLEDRFFNQPSSSPQAKTPNPDVVITAPSFDENARPGSSAEAPEPEKRKKSFMENAQEQGRIFQRKLSSQADSIKTKFSNLKKSKAEPETIEEPKEEVVEITTETIETSTVPKKNRFQKPDFTKLKGHLPEFKRPDMPKLKKPNFEKIKAMKRPSFDRPRMPDIPKMDFNKHIQSMKKLGRSKSVKEESASEQAEEAQEVPVEPEIEPTGSETLPTKKKKFDIDFRTYPRMITNKFKKSKKPEQVPSVQKITPILKPRAKGGKKELDTESGQFTEYNKDIDLDRETSVERRMRVHLEKAIEEYRQIEEEEKQTKQESLPRKKKGKKTIPQPESFDSREFDFNQNEMDSEGASKASTQEIQDIIQRSQQRQFGRTDTQSLQSGDRRGVLEEIDDDQFFLRKKGISEDNIQMGEYISSAIREGLMDPVNVLAQMGQFDDYQLDEDEIRYLQEIEKQGSDFQLELDEKLLPYKPGRRQKKQSSEEISDDQQGKWEPIKDIDEDSIELSNRDFSRFVPPTPPKRRKKRNAPLPKTQNSKNLNGYEELQNLPHQQEVNVYRQEQTFAVPLAKAESGDSFIPVPAARRSRSRSQSVLKDENKAFNVIEELSEIPGYAVIKKDPPPRPPAPQSRRSKSTRSHERPFNTMPRLGNHESTPERPARNYSTIIPDRPPRKPTTEHEKSATPYEEISDTNDEVVKKLISGEVVSKMKDRPLPAPPRPPREKGRKSVEPPKDDDQPKPDDDENQDDHKGGSAVRGILETADSFTSNEYKIEEVDAWCQTDPLPDDFQLEELEITDDMRTITPTMYRNQETDQRDAHMHVLERFSRPETPSIEQELQRIREGRPSSRHSITASRTPSRPTTPALVYVERKISTPLLNNEEQIEASLTAHQVEIDFDEETGNVIVTGLVADKPEPIAQVQERTEEDILKSLEAEIIRASEPENEIVAVKLAPIESQPEEQRPVEEPIIEPTRAPIRYQPEIEPEIESVIQPEEPQKEPEPTVVVHQVEPAIPTLPQQTPQVQSEPIQPQQPTLQQLSPDQPLHLSNLSVDRLSVNELQASKISVSELDSSTINSREIQCQSGNLNMRSIEIPPGVIEEIVERVSRVQREQFADRQSPIISIPPPSFYQLSSEPQQQQQQQEQPQLPVEEPVAPPRRSRQVPTTPVEDAPSADQPSILSLTGQLASACGSELSRQGSNLLNYLRSFKKDQNRRDVHFVLFVLIIIIAGLFMIGMDHTDRTVHHHHWDFFNPPRNGDHKKIIH